MRQSKYDPLVDEVQLIEANSMYAYIRYPDGRESSVSIRDLAPCGSANDVVPILAGEEPSDFDHSTRQMPAPKDPSLNMDDASLKLSEMSASNDSEVPSTTTEDTSDTPSLAADSAKVASPPPECRGSVRIRKPPDRLNIGQF